MMENPNSSNEILSSSERTHRKWEFYEGYTRFWCNGRCLHLKLSEFMFFIGILSFITINFILFLTFTASYLAENLTIAAPILVILLYLYTISNGLFTTLMDPGILPRASPLETQALKESVSKRYPTETVRIEATTMPAQLKGQELFLKFCRTCKFYRPPRAGHCSTCNNCVDRLDHHCPYLAACVGRRNYSKFYAFLVCSTLLSLCACGFSTYHVVAVYVEKQDFVQMLSAVPVSWYLALATFAGAIPLVGLLCYHTILCCKGITTREEVKEAYLSGTNPFDRGGPCKNWLGTLCSSIPSSFIDGNGIATKEYMEAFQLTYPTSHTHKDEHDNKEAQCNC